MNLRAGLVLAYIVGVLAREGPVHLSLPFPHARLCV